MSCTSCETPTADGVHLCIECVLRLEAILDAAPETLEDAQTTIARMDRLARSPGGGGASRDGVNAEAMDRALTLRELLTSWARLTLEVCDERGVDVGRGLEPARLLREHTGVVRLEDWAGDCLSELEEAHRRLLQAVDLPPDMRTLGPCLEPECAGVVRGTVAGRWARCRACGFEYPAAQLVALRIADSWESPAPLKRVCLAMESAGFPVPHRTLRSWVERGKLQAEGQDERGRPTYSMAQVLQLRRAA